jgi:probable rRNA maturation factor
MEDPTPTDVITFHHGEIFICPEIAEKQRKEEGLSLHEEVLTYIVHGLLHLTGMNDHSKKDFEAMKKRQTTIVTKILR